MAKLSTLLQDSSKPTRTWDKSHGVYIAGRAYLDEADATAADMERKWGAGRLRLLVSPELREKFDRQRYLLNQAIWHGDLESVRRESQRMVRAWLALDRQAEEGSQKPADASNFEIALSDGVVAVITPTGIYDRPEGDERAIRVYSLDEIGRMIVAFPDIVKAKAVFPGASVVSIKHTISDPLDDIHDTSGGLDDDIPF